MSERSERGAPVRLAREWGLARAPRCDELSDREIREQQERSAESPTERRSFI